MRCRTSSSPNTSQKAYLEVSYPSLFTKSFNTSGLDSRGSHFFPIVSTDNDGRSITPSDLICRLAVGKLEQCLCCQLLPPTVTVVGHRRLQAVRCNFAVSLRTLLFRKVPLRLLLQHNHRNLIKCTIWYTPTGTEHIEHNQWTLLQSSRMPESIPCQCLDI